MQVFGTYYFPDLALALMYLVMLTVLVVRPGGLLGKEAWSDERLAWLGCGGVRAGARPAGLPPYAMTLLTEALILGLFAMSLDLMVGYTRLLSFGHAAAYGLGAYTCGNLLLHTGMPLVFAVLLAVLFSGIVAIGVAWVCTLASGVSFSMLTLAFAQLLYAVAFKWTASPAHPTGWRAFRAVRARSASPSSPARPASTIWCSPVCSGRSLFCRSLVRSPFGAVLQGIRENEAKTLSLGYNTRRYKIAVGGDLLRARRPGRRAVCAVRRLRQHRAAVLAVVRPGADHGDRRRRRAR